MKIYQIALIFISLLLVPILQSHEESDNKTINEINKNIEKIRIENQKALNEISLDIGKLQTSISNLQNEAEKVNQNLSAIQDANNKLENIHSTLIKNQEQDEKIQLMYTVAQVSGIFVAIVGGFVTTKVINMTTDKNRIQNRIREINSQINSKNKIVEYYQEIKDRIGRRWAERDVNSFKSELLSSSDLKPYTKEELFKKFQEIERREPDEYETEILEQKYDEIIEEINNKINQRKSNPFSTIIPLSEIALSFPFPQGQIADFKLAEEKLAHEVPEVSHLKNLKDELQRELNEIILPHSFGRGILILLFSALIGIVVPLTYSYWEKYVPDNFEIGIGISSFLICLLFSSLFFGYEIMRELTIIPAKKSSKDHKSSKDKS